MAGAVILEFDDVFLSHGGKRVLDRVSFRQPEGVSIGILGAQGAGKTSLLDLVLGTNVPSSGHIRRNGLFSMPIGAPATLHRLLSGREITRITAGLYGIDPDTLCRFVNEFAELGAAFDKPLRHFNSVQRSRFVFTLSYGVPVDCYLADGTLFGGDAAFRDRCLDLARQRKQDAAFFFTTKSPRDLRNFADIGAILENGRLRFYPSVQSAIAAFTANGGAE